MNRFIAMLSCLLLLSAYVFGQSFYIEQQTTSNGMGMGAGTSIQKTWYTSDKIRTESSKDSKVTLIRLVEDKVYMLDSGQKTYSVVPLEEFNQMASMGMSMMQGQAGKVTVEKTGQTKKIDNYDCYEVVLKMGGMSQDLWFTKDVKIGKELFYNLQKKMPGAAKIVDALYNNKDIEGIPVYTETDISMGGFSMKSTSKVIKLEQTTPAASLFEIPSGYKEVPSPFKNMKEQMQNLQQMQNKQH